MQASTYLTVEGRQTGQSTRADVVDQAVIYRHYVSIINPAE